MFSLNAYLMSDFETYPLKKGIPLIDNIPIMSKMAVKGMVLKTP